jgi:hypothetical protein
MKHIMIAERVARTIDGENCSLRAYYGISDKLANMFQTHPNSKVISALLVQMLDEEIVLFLARYLRKTQDERLSGVRACDPSTKQGFLHCGAYLEIYQAK